VNFVHNVGKEAVTVVRRGVLGTSEQTPVTNRCHSAAVAPVPLGLGDYNHQRRNQNHETRPQP